MLCIMVYIMILNVYNFHGNFDFSGPFIPREPRMTSFVAPVNGMAALRCRIFKDLHQKGYWLTSGGKFGGDFLVYPGTSK